MIIYSIVDNDGNDDISHGYDDDDDDDDYNNNDEEI